MLPGSRTPAHFTPPGQGRSDRRPGQRARPTTQHQRAPLGRERLVRTHEHRFPTGKTAVNSGKQLRPVLTNRTTRPSSAARSEDQGIDPQQTAADRPGSRLGLRGHQRTAIAVGAVVAGLIVVGAPAAAIGLTGSSSPAPAAKPGPADRDDAHAQFQVGSGGSAAAAPSAPASASASPSASSSTPSAGGDYYAYLRRGQHRGGRGHPGRDHRVRRRDRPVRGAGHQRGDRGPRPR
jgi:hypothetical protein